MILIVALARDFGAVQQIPNEATPQTDEMYRSPGHGSTKDRVAPVEQLTNARQ